MRLLRVCAQQLLYSVRSKWRLTMKLQRVGTMVGMHLPYYLSC